VPVLFNLPAMPFNFAKGADARIGKPLLARCRSGRLATVISYPTNTLTLRRQSPYTSRAYADGLMCHAFNLERRADSVLFHDEDHRAIPVPASFQRQ
jgi:hypothetical protein